MFTLSKIGLVAILFTVVLGNAFACEADCPMKKAAAEAKKAEEGKKNVEVKKADSVKKSTDVKKP